MFVKKLAVLLIVLLFLGGCSGKQEELERAMTLRAKLLASECSFDAKITADYGDKLYAFAMTCQGDSRGNLTFTVTEPESIAGITGIISQDGGRLTFDDTALYFDLLTDDQLSPVSAPWIFLKALRGGYITSVCREEASFFRTRSGNWAAYSPTTSQPELTAMAPSRSRALLPAQL